MSAAQRVLAARVLFTLHTFHTVQKNAIRETRPHIRLHDNLSPTVLDLDAGRRNPHH